MPRWAGQADAATTAYRTGTDTAADPGLSTEAAGRSMVRPMLPNQIRSSCRTFLMRRRRAWAWRATRNGAAWDSVTLASNSREDQMTSNHRKPIQDSSQGELWSRPARSAAYSGCLAEVTPGAGQIK
jgi:hypothetical protein